MTKEEIEVFIVFEVELTNSLTTAKLVTAYPILRRKYLMKFVKLIRYKNRYRQDNNYSDENLSFLALLFLQFSTVEWIKRELLDTTSKGIVGNSLELIIENDEVIIAHINLPEEADINLYAIKIKRNILLNLVYHWEELVTKKVPEIIFVQQDDTIFLTDTMPQEIK